MLFLGVVSSALKTFIPLLKLKGEEFIFMFIEGPSIDLPGLSPVGFGIVEPGLLFTMFMNIEMSISFPFYTGGPPILKKS